ncbi:hypothetical protein U732_3274 [Clostridium argentinense CDC 2741]|uniref:DUF1963 domain-containing protein n=1 Tax=Clostridium argentinense CDC 2741 TaxID=1418104 RepID=A0A0C1UHC9_9CLOT|nr:hypothetical protein [Clostridium argentinense]ARC86530.1 DUF1963 domain-containing protein [Clostridium argentinense]KIE46795.1 hypothetical protein U732_3274 [Clostridium argentinense CDC 2741]NFF37994.1 DUF1963 domain-containing protein [Clostridium argentinense]NFP49976.1 DUF1963 domain-containing protein [Clostridium argentinense]NFP71386.1 DUF1963 domain-containing protein [Clostridium argentinense]
MSERIPCRSEGCKATILQTTADRTGGYCMPCYQEIKRKEYEEYIKKNRKDINLYDGITDPVEILKIMHTPKKYNPLENYVKYEKSIEEMYSSLSKEDIERMKAYVIKLIEDENIEMAQEILLPIVCYTNTEIEECLRALIKKNECYPEVIFKDATVGVRDYLIEQVSKGSDTLSLNHMLSALAWIGDERVVHLFHEWKKNTPKWRNKLYVPPEEYSLEAGWELTEDGERRDLFYRDCYAIEKKNDAEDEPILFLQIQDKKCEWCGGDLVNLFSFDLTNSLFQFMNLNGVRLNIATCHVCNCYGTIYTDIDTNGAVHWSKLNIKPQYLCDANDEEAITPKGPIRMSRVKRNCYHAASQFLETTFSQIGGHPTWIQDAEYPKCPKCSKHMKFIGQVDWADIVEYGEGMYYAFICEECNIAATNYQQS